MCPKDDYKSNFVSDEVKIHKEVEADNLALDALIRRLHAKEYGLGPEEEEQGEKQSGQKHDQKN